MTILRSAKEPPLLRLVQQRSGHPPTKHEWGLRNAVKRVHAVYPREAARQGILGDVVMSFVVDRTGAVVAACAASGPEILRESAEQAMMQWMFRPDPGREHRYIYDYGMFHFVAEDGQGQLLDHER
jgi:TonB family protein